MRNNRPSRRSRSNPFSRLFQKATPAARKAPRRRDVERLEERQLLTASPQTNEFFENQWYLFANGQQTEFDPSSATLDQTLAVAGEDINVLPAWAQGLTGAGIQVAIIDGGFDLTHEDLVFVTTNFPTTTEGLLDQLSGDADPSFVDTTDFSGTALAGLVGALDNDLGIVGVAHGADLIPVRLVPGTGDIDVATVEAINRAFRLGSGTVQDSNGDGIPDGELSGSFVAVDIDGDGVTDGFGTDPNLVTDIYLHSGRFQTADFIQGDNTNRASLALDPLVAEALEDTANAGRAIWVDANGDGLLDAGEIVSLGSIHVVPAGNDGGTQSATAVSSIGSFASSQYDQLANSRFTIAVGAVDYDGELEDNATGNERAFGEMGANVLIVAPTSLSQIDFATGQDLNSSLLSTDLTGEIGANVSPVFNFEFDGDYVADIDYTSAIGGTEAAAAQVAGVIALMLEANPNLSNRDVQEILVKSARQNDQFSETWVVNQMQFFQDNYVIPEYVYYDFDTDGDGVPDIENGIVPNFVIDPATGLPVVNRNFFTNEPDFNIGVLGGSQGEEAFVDATGVALDEDGNVLTVVGGTNLPFIVTDPDADPLEFAPAFPDPLFLFEPGSVPDEQGIGRFYVTSPLFSDGVDLEFENGAGYTVSWGYGRGLEETGYAHGVVDAGLAVELAMAYAENDEYAAEEVVVSSGIRGANGANYAIQPRVLVPLSDSGPDLFVPGGNSTEGINAGFYTEFLEGFDVEEVEAQVGEDTVPLGEIITSAPFYDPDNEGVPDNTRGTNFLPLEFDPSVEIDYLSAEWVEVRLTLESGNIDDLRLSLIAPDGTQSELNAFRPTVDAIGTNTVFQTTQGKQGKFLPSDEAIDETLGPLLLDDVISGSDQYEVGGRAAGTPTSLAAGTTWTFTTNRHWGEILTTDQNSPEDLGGSGQWFLGVENFGTGFVEINTEIIVDFYGTEVTGNRIQGKVGIDDNAQQIEGTDADENFNFNRYVEFAEFAIDIDGFPDFQAVVLDDATDGVTYSNGNTPGVGRPDLDGIYKTVDPDTGDELLYPVIDRDAYFSADFSDLTDPNTVAINAALTNFFAQTADAAPAAVTVSDVFTMDTAGLNRLTYRNFDYSQESFASAVTVAATQYEVQYDATGNVVSRQATGVVDHVTTGADGNYYFDVEATPAVPDVAMAPTSYAEWFFDFGGISYEYEISLVGDDDLQGRIIENNYGGIPAGTGVINDPLTDSNNQQAEFSYRVQIFSDVAQFNSFADATVIDDVNFLLEVDPALTNVDVTGTVFRDRNGDGSQDVGLEESIANVTVFYDADRDGVLGVDEISAITDSDGAYSLTIAGLTSPQTAILQVVESTIPADLEFFSPANGIRSINVTPGLEASADFSLRKLGGEPAQVTGIVFEDVDQDGIQDVGEVGVDASKQLRVYIDIDGNDVFDEAVDISALTQADGSFIIESANSGTFEVRIDENSTPLSQTTPLGGAGFETELVVGQTVSGLAFGVFDTRNQDFGDLFVDPTIGANFPTLLADNGARHVVIPGIRLGASVDIDSDGFQNPTRNPGLDGLGDDFNGIDDEDGVVLVDGEFLANDSLQFAIEAYGQGAVLNAWIDFNGNGQWESHEQIFTDLSDIAFGPNGEAPSQSIPAVPVPDLRQADQPADGAFLDPSVDFYAARFRWGPFGLSPEGAANAGEVEDYLFAATPPIVITGSVRDDTADGNGVFDPTDVGVGGVRVFYDINVDGVVDVDEPRAFTDANGEYRLEVNTNTDLDLTIRIDTSTLPVGIETLMPSDGIFNQTVAVSGVVESNYLVGAPQGLTGNVFSDADNDAVRDVGEAGFAGIVVEVYQDADSNGSFETLINSATTDANGDYLLPIESAGLYSVQLNLAGTQFLTQTLPASSGSRTVSVTGGTFVTVADFGVFDSVPTFTLDYGDLIVDGTRNFPTTLVDDGARHTLVSGVFLGTVAPDADPGTFESADATADDTLFTPDDEDGVQMQSNIAADSIVRIDVTATGDSANRLHAWIDFNNDGDWDDPGEQITGVGGNTLPSGSTSQLVIDTTGIEVDETATSYAARFRWGQGITGYTGLASTGEVEDYLLPRINSTIPTGDPLVSDFNGDGVVDLLDLDVLGSNFGAGPGAILAQGDANGDGNVDLLDLDLLGSEFGSVAASSSLALAIESDDDTTVGPQIALATASIDPEGVPPLVLHPIVEDVLQPVVLDANAFAPMLLASPTVESAVDESLAVEGDLTETGDSIDAALLEWSLAGVAGEEEEADVFSSGSADDEADETEASDELFARVFAF